MAELKRAREEPATPLPLVADLLAELHRRGVRYCHWKSTPSISVALQGKTDLDLLVDRQHASAFATAIREVGFKPFISSPARRFPGVEDHIGHDEASGRLVHLHVYFQLVLGEEHVKNHRLPLEQAFLDGARERLGIMVPPPALELTVLALRVLLKYRTTDALKDWLGLGQRGGIPPDARRELAALRTEVSDDELRTTMAEQLPAVDRDLVPQLLAVIAAHPRDAGTLQRLRGRARKGLRSYERLPRRQALTKSLRARVIRTWPLRLIVRGLSRSDLRRKAPAAGGLTVAVVGPDGAGKSTVIGALDEWLAWRVNVREYYLGSARPSRRTRGLRWASRAARALARRTPAIPPLARLANILTAARYLGDARDRAHRVRAARSVAARGAVAIFDRFPLAGVRVGERDMDGARIPTLPGWERSASLRAMAARERALYAEIPPPDHIVWLALDPAIALARKPNRAHQSVEDKARALEEASLERLAPVTRIDAAQPLDDVLVAVRRAIWQLL